MLTALEVALEAPLIGKPLKGAVSISGRLRFDNVSHTPSEFKVKPGELVISLLPKATS